MANGEDFFLKMCRDAQNDLARGSEGWRNCASNTLLLACFGMFYEHVTKRITRPLWFFSGSIAAAVIGWLIKVFIS